MKYFSPATSTAIVRCPRAHYRLIWAALTFINRIPLSKKHPEFVPCVFQVVRVSGTIKKSEEEAIKRARAAIIKAKKETTTNAMAGLDAILSQPSNHTGLDAGKQRSNLNNSIEDSDLEDDPESDPDIKGR